MIPAERATLALRTLAAVLPPEDPVLDGDGAGVVDLPDLLLFLYIQSYKSMVATWKVIRTSERTEERGEGERGGGTNERNPTRFKDGAISSAIIQGGSTGGEMEELLLVGRS
jgi:hypothetical protein